MIDRGGEVGDRPTGGPGADGPTGGSARRFPIIVALALALLAAAGVAGLVLRGDHPSGRAGGATAVTETGQPTPQPTRPRRASAQSQVFYTAPDGDDAAAGTRSSPWRTLGAALPRLEPGDTLVVGGGRYEELLRDVAIRRGRADSPITVRAAPGQRPVLKGLLWLTHADYWDISGLNVTWSSAAGPGDHMVKFTDGTGWSFTDAELSDAHSYAALLVNGHVQRFRLAGLYVHDTYPSNGENQDHLIYINADARSGLIERCILARSPNGRAIKIGPPEKSHTKLGYLVIRYNTMLDNRGPSNVQLSYRVNDVEIYGNIMVGAGAGEANVTAFHLTGSGNVVRDNLVYDSAGAVDPGAAGLRDGGGNVVADPGFTAAAGGGVTTTNPAAAGFGRYAGSTS